MAIWQVAFKLIPSDSIDFADTFMLDPQSLKQLENDLPRSQSWSDDNLLYGLLDNTCVELFYFESKLDEISVRIHAGETSPKRICCIEKFAINNNLRILYNNEIVSASIGNISDIIKNSKAFSYVHNSGEFWNSLNE